MFLMLYLGNFCINHCHKHTLGDFLLEVLYFKFYIKFHDLFWVKVFLLQIVQKHKIIINLHMHIWKTVYQFCAQLQCSASIILLFLFVVGCVLFFVFVFYFFIEFIKGGLVNKSILVSHGILLFLNVFSWKWLWNCFLD